MTKIIKNLFRQSFRWYFSVIAGLCVIYFTGGNFAAFGTFLGIVFGITVFSMKKFN